MIRKPVRLLLFLSSYAPLFLILSIQMIHFEWVTSLQDLVIGIIPTILILIGCISILLLIILLELLRNAAKERVMVWEIDNSNADVLSYIATYLIPFLGFKFDTYWANTSNVLIFLMIWYLYTHSGMIHINPALSLLWYQIYRIETDKGFKRIVISNVEITKNSILKAVKLTNNTYYYYVTN